MTRYHNPHIDTKGGRDIHAANPDIQARGQEMILPTPPMHCTASLFHATYAIEMRLQYIIEAIDLMAERYVTCADTDNTPYSICLD
jgi:hypothetical protein